MGASYPIIHSGVRCRRSDPDAHQYLLVVGWHRATARKADLRRHPPCGIPKSSIQLTGFAIEVDPKSIGEPLYIAKRELATQFFAGPFLHGRYDGWNGRNDGCRTSPES